jgi:multiple sugar transport system substrate-binding protein
MLMLEPQILAPWIAQQSYLPTQVDLGEGKSSYTELLRTSILYYDQMISMIHVGRGRPNIPQNPAISDNIRQALDEVYYGLKDPNQALQEAAAKSAKVLGCRRRRKKRCQ